MAYDDPETQRRMSVGNGINAAAALAAGQDNPLEYFGTIVGDVVEKVLELQEEHAIKDVFEGTTDATVLQFTLPTNTVPPVVASAPVQGYGPAPVSQPAAIPGAADGDPRVAAIWQEFFANPKKFWDNRNDKRNPRAPDYKHKDDSDKALWLDDRKNPSWVHSNLVSRGLVPA